jgi:hypothetical protein
MPLATDIYSGNVFQFMKLEESMAGEDSEPVQEKILNQRERVPNWQEHILQSEKYNSGENSGVQKVQNQNNHRIPWNFEWISQPSFIPLQCNMSKEGIVVVTAPTSTIQRDDRYCH